MLPLIRCLCLLAACLYHDCGSISTRPPGIVCCHRPLASCHRLVFLRSGLPTIYASPHSWITASDWVYRHYPSQRPGCGGLGHGVAAALDVDGRPVELKEYNIQTLPLYDEPDGDAKWAAIADDLAASVYLIVASTGSTARSCACRMRYPVTNPLLRTAVCRGLGFELAGEFTRGPACSIARAALPARLPALIIPTRVSSS